MPEQDTDVDIEQLGDDSGLDENTEEHDNEIPDDPDQLKAMLQEERAARVKAEEEARHRQSVSDRQYNEHAKELAELRGRLEGMQTGAGSNLVDQKEFDAELAERIANDTDGKTTLQIMREMMGEIRQDVLSEIKRTQATVKESLLESNSVYRDNRETIDEIMKDSGVSKEAAIKIFEKFAPKKTSQPGRVQAPGRTNGNTQAINTPRKNRVSELGASPVGDRVAQDLLVSLGVTAEEARHILTKEVDA